MSSTKSDYTTVPIDISNEVFMYIAAEAHKRDITFNRACILILEHHIAKISTTEEYLNMKAGKPILDVEEKEDE